MGNALSCHEVALGLEWAGKLCHVKPGISCMNIFVNIMHVIRNIIVHKTPQTSPYYRDTEILMDE